MLYNDTRESLVRDYEKDHDAQKIAQAYAVSERTVYRLASQKRVTGTVALQTTRRGRKSALSKADRERMEILLEKAPHITAKALKEKLELKASYTTVQRFVMKWKAQAANQRRRGTP